MIKYLNEGVINKTIIAVVLKKIDSINLQIQGDSSENFLNALFEYSKAVGNILNQYFELSFPAFRITCEKMVGDTRNYMEIRGGATQSIQFKGAIGVVASMWLHIDRAIVAQVIGKGHKATELLELGAGNDNPAFAPLRQKMFADFNAMWHSYTKTHLHDLIEHELTHVMQYQSVTKSRMPAMLHKKDYNSDNPPTYYYSNIEISAYASEISRQMHREKVPLTKLNDKAWFKKYLIDHDDYAPDLVKMYVDGENNQSKNKFYKYIYLYYQQYLSEHKEVEVFDRQQAQFLQELKTLPIRFDDMSATVDFDNAIVTYGEHFDSVMSKYYHLTQTPCTEFFIKGIVKSPIKANFVEFTDCNIELDSNNIASIKFYLQFNIENSIGNIIKEKNLQSFLNNEMEDKRDLSALYQKVYKDFRKMWVHQTYPKLKELITKELF